LTLLLDNPPATPIHYSAGTDTRPALITYFVVLKSKQMFVSYNGYYANSGSWACKVHRSAGTCEHITAAQELGVHKQLLWDAQLNADITSARAEAEEQLVEERERSTSLALPAAWPSPTSHSRPTQPARPPRRTLHFISTRRPPALVPVAFRHDYPNRRSDHPA
jgi:hypothetical protein